jgi:hypothetical protein
MLLQISNIDGRIYNWGLQPWSNQDDYIDYSIIDIGDQTIPDLDLSDYRYISGDFIYSQLPPTNEEETNLRLNASELSNKTPQEIYDIVQARIDSWTSLAEAKADFREWMPLIFAGMMWMVKRD